MLPHTTKRRTTTNLKTKSNQNCQKIELYGSLTTKELKKKHSSRLVGGAEKAARLEKTQGKVVARGLGGRVSSWSHICMQIIINQEEQLGRETDHTIQGSRAGKESLRISGCKNLLGLWRREKLPASQESSLETPTRS